MTSQEGNEKHEAEISGAETNSIANEIKINQLTQENQSLSEHVKNLEQENSKMQIELEKLKTEHANYASPIEMETSLQKLADENIKLNKEISNLKSSLKTLHTSQEAHQKTTEQYLALKEDHRSLTIANNEQEIRCSKLREEVLKLKLKLEQGNSDIKSMNDSLNTQISELKAKTEELNKNNATLQQKVDELEGIKTALEERISYYVSKENEYMENEKKFIELQVTHRLLTNEFTKFKFHAEIKSKEVDSLTKLYTEKFAEKEQKINELNQKILELNDSIRSQNRKPDGPSIVVNYTIEKSFQTLCKELDLQNRKLRDENMRLKNKLASTDSIKQQVQIKEEENHQIKEEYSKFKNTAYMDIAKLQEARRSDEKRIQTLINSSSK